MKPFFKLLLGATLSAHSVFAQEAQDVILKTNGEEMTGKVTEVNDDNLKFQYKGETVTYTVKRSEIFRVTFASGRVQLFNQPSGATASAKSNDNHLVVRNQVDHKNRVAILPFRFSSDRDGDRPEEMSYTAQEEAYNLLQKNLAGKTLLDLPTTNALLLKSNVTLSSLRSYTPKELCDILGVETLVQCNVSVRLSNVVSSINQNTNVNVKENNNGKTGSNGGSISGTSNSTSTTQRSYQNKVAVVMYNDSGTTLYSEDRVAFFNLADSYKDALKYLLKRSPIYQR